ncbi:MAG: bifunctional DNA-formamidopyrimidine glycosylase/DNA-(apurinic or apyrimidinic site) lyase [Bradymonadia bacterium]
MPELPEVEICARNLRRWLVGRRIKAVDALDGIPLRGIAAAEVRAALSGRTVDDVCRRGKQMWLPLDDGRVVLTHLGMTGKYVQSKAGEPRRKGWRVALTLDDGTEVLFADPRRIGRFSVVDARGLETAVDALGPDALESGHQSGVLYSALQKTRRAVKVALLDQHLIAGIGNIYACEGLWYAGIHPSKRASALSIEDCDQLSNHVAECMSATLERDMSPEVTYIHEGAENPFAVYGREGEQCRRCTSTLLRMTQGGRSTFWCPQCQPEA